MSKEPWKDRNTLDGLYHGDGLNQSEIAEHFSENGNPVDPSTISYWMNKLEVNTTHTKHDGSRNGDGIECVNYEKCGNITCGPQNTLCTDCLDARRGLVGRKVQ